MSFDDYANHIYQKHRLAVALAIIKSKPANVKTDKYLEELKSKIDHKMDDDDFSVCSNDFLMGDEDEMNDSVTILKDFDPEFVNNDDNILGDNNAAYEKPPTISLVAKSAINGMGNIQIPLKCNQPITSALVFGPSDFTNSMADQWRHVEPDMEEHRKRQNPPEIIDINLPENESQITYYDSSQTEFSANITDITISQGNHNPNREINIELTTPFFGNDEINDRISIVDQNAVEKKSTSKNNNEKVGSNYKPVATPNESMDETYYDSQKTQLYTVHGFTQNYTHYSPSQNDIFIPNKYLYGVNKNKNVSTVPNKDLDGENNTSAVNINDFDKESQFVTKGSHSVTVEKPTNREEFESIKTMNMLSQNNDDNFDEIQYNNTYFNSDSNKTMNNINIIVNKDLDSNNIQNTIKFSQNIDEIQIIEDNVIRNSFPTQNYMNRNGENLEIADMEMTDEPFRFSQNIDYLSQNNEISYTKNKFEKSVHMSKDKDINQYINTENLTQNSKKDYQLATIASGNDSSDQNKDRVEEEYESEEIISYKVLEEFNKVKSFLKRENRRMSCDGYSTDSGYRSDSQRSSNRSALQLSGNWLNQSGCCLFNYIMQCPLVASTRDITDEIAQVLSQLVDRLHEGEKYPSFLEDLLETVDLLLLQVYEGESSEDSKFLEKDENIQRILLLNKSIHIQKHSIEKMSKILESFHSKVTATESTYELSNIDQIENITYIFHILEILLKKYLKNREILSQSSTQNSPNDEKVFKKSSISDIWRKKWNPSQKVFEGSRDKKCVLKDCSEILNRIIVDCVSCYSLIAYSALKCFNSMQT